MVCEVDRVVIAGVLLVVLGADLIFQVLRVRRWREWSSVNEPTEFAGWFRDAFNIAQMLYFKKGGPASLVTDGVGCYRLFITSAASCLYGCLLWYAYTAVYYSMQKIWEPSPRLKDPKRKDT